MKTSNRNIKDLSLDGGVLCFDFINTVHSRNEEVLYDYLKSYDEFLVWCRMVNLLEPGDVNKLKSIADNNQEEVQRAFSKIINARETLYDFFSSYSKNKNVNDLVLTKFNNLLSKSLSKIMLIQTRKDFNIGWKNKEDLLYPLVIIIKSAYDLITDFPKNRIKECSACGWIFLDKSKNSSRKWCSMETCGSIDKSLRYYYRNKDKHLLN